MSDSANSTVKGIIDFSERQNGNVETGNWLFKCLLKSNMLLFSVNL